MKWIDLRGSVAFALMFALEEFAISIPMTKN